MIVVRRCSSDELVAVETSWPIPGDVHRAHYAAQRSGTATYLIGWVDAEPLGSGMIQWKGCSGPNARRAYPDAVEINHLQVRPECRGRGVGTAIIQDAEIRAAGRRRTLVALGVEVGNERAVRLYRRLGYEPTGVLDTFAYSWIDSDGISHSENETSELLVKHL
ncbi:MAG TPA: GNAT family N-acetyltransferase [Mycobacteriales bacterium]|nr:GNAT family N-acetyltransferase [Mycobacteriales bacterium]